MQLEKATLQVISSDESARPLGEPVPVQFNPSTLRLEISNSTEGGESRGRQARQYMGSSSTKLNLELIFDTADEGATGSPRSVREKTQIVEQFVYPTGEGENKQAPPKLRFQWGDLVLEGVVESVTIDFDHFAANGVPLRAKVGFSFKEQDRRYQFLSAGPGANKAGSAPLSGGLSLGAGLSLGVVGSAGIGFGVQAGIAIGGETAAGFAVRMGLDTEAWRGLSLGSGNPLSLEAGIEIGFSANISASAGIGVQAGASAGVGVSPQGAFGLKPETGVRSVPAAGASSALQQQFTAAEAGGVGAAIESVKISETSTAENRTREAFALPTKAAAPARPVLPDQTRTPLISPTAAAQPGPAAAPPPPRADKRAASFGFGVPLRTVAGPAAIERSGAVPVTSDPSSPAWVALPAAGSTKTSGPSVRRRKCNCGCSPCGH
jgi:hypothetical protein